MRVGLITAAAACVVAAAPVDAATRLRARLQGYYVGGSPIFAADGLVPEPAPSNGRFSVIIDYGLQASGIAQDTSGASFNIEAGGFGVDKATGRGSLRAQNECRCVYDLQVSFTAPVEAVRGYSPEGYTLIQGGKSYQLTDVTSLYGGTLSNVTLSGVPEPTTWALLILGFGAVGGAMRRRQATVTDTLIPS